MKQEVNEFQKRNVKQTQSNNISRPENYLDDIQLEELKAFCQDLNPYVELSLEQKLRLQEYGIKDFSDPFSITNKLLLLLENNLQYRENS